MILKKVIDECKRVGGECKHCNIKKETCQHAADILMVRKPVDYKEEKK